VAEEQERLRQEAERKAREEREAELARMEAEALAKEEASTDLSDREEAFVTRYMAIKDPERAAAFAGYKNPFQAATRLMSLPKVQTAIRERQEAIALRQQATARAAQPIEVEVEEVKANVSRGGGGYERTTWTAEVLDEPAFIRAVIEGKSGIPLDVLTVNQTVLNSYARSLQSRLDLWKGVRAVKKTVYV
jgi:hypothetical protein